MQKKEIYQAVDHTLLLQDATWSQIKEICDDAVRYGTASVCIPPSYVARAKEYLGDRMAVCTVIGFPNGYNTTAVKVFETKEAIREGADEIDMVINIGDLKDKQYDKILEEIRAVKEACGSHILKVIIETCLLTEEEKVKMCQLVTQSGAAKHVGPHVKLKAAGGIASFADAEQFLKLGASRLGTSRIVKLAKAEEEGHGTAADAEGY